MYEPSIERVAAITEAASDAANPLETHYDANKEVRAKGAAFYSFSADEETRRKQMEELKASRVETEQTRKETGAVEVRPGEIEGMRVDDDKEEDGADVLLKSRAIEKRKREIEERRKLVEAKRRKMGTNVPSLVDATRPETAPSDEGSDPFAKLEQGSATNAPRKIVLSKKDDAEQSEADKFLADLERDMLGSKAKR